MTMMSRMYSTRVLVVFLGAFLVSMMGGCAGSGYDLPPNTELSLHVKILSWRYQDNPFPVQTILKGISTDTGKPVDLPKGPYQYTFRLFMENGNTFIIPRKANSPAVWRGNMNRMTDMPKVLAVGTYGLDASVRLPGGQFVRDPLKQRFVVRKREMQLVLKTDKLSYQRGEVIHISAQIKNISHRPLTIPKASPLSLRANGNIANLPNATFPSQLAPEGIYPLGTWKFVVGKSSPKPFNQRGTVRMQLLLRTQITMEQLDGSIDNLDAIALPGTVTVKIE